MPNILKEALKKTGPCLSNELSRFLEIEHGLSPEAARQRVSRGGPGVKKLKGLTFPKRASFVYLENQHMSDRYSRALQKSILNSASSYSHALMSILSRGGVVTKNNFKISCGSPAQQKKKISSESIIERFTSCRVVDEVFIPGIGDCLAVPMISEKLEQSPYLVNDLRAKITCEKIILEAACDWAKNLGIVSYNKVDISDNESNLPLFGTHYWNMAAPSYLTGICSFKDQKITPGFFVCDIHLGKKIGERSILPFLQKISSTQALKNLGRCIYMHIADNYKEESFKALKSKGIIPATPKSLFGEDVAYGLKELFHILRDPYHTGVSTEQYKEIFEKLSIIKGVAGNLRGALFEFITSDIVRKNEAYTDIDMNMIIKKDGKDVAESDVVIYEKNKKVRFIECKAHGKEGFVDIKEIKKWLHSRVPKIRKHALDHTEWKSLDLEFSLWTTGKISTEALEIIEKCSEERKKYTINYKDGEQVLTEARRTKDKSLIELLESHFIYHGS